MVMEAPKRNSEIDYSSVKYDDPKVIQALLRHMNECKVMEKKELNIELMSIILDMEKAILNVDLTDKQRKVMQLYMLGYTEEQIGRLLNGQTHQAIHKLLMKVCRKISNYLK